MAEDTYLELIRHLLVANKGRKVSLRMVADHEFKATHTFRNRVGELRQEGYVIETIYHKPSHGETPSDNGYVLWYEPHEVPKGQAVLFGSAA